MWQRSRELGRLLLGEDAMPARRSTARLRRIGAPDAGSPLRDVQNSSRIRSFESASSRRSRGHCFLYLAGADLREEERLQILASCWVMVLRAP